MAITQMDKMKILKYFRETAFGEIYYDDLVKYLGKRSKVTDTEFTEFFANYVIDILDKGQFSLSLLCKMISTLSSFVGWLHDDEVELAVDLVNKLYSIREKYEQYLINNNIQRDNNLDDLISTLEKDLKDSYTLVEVENDEIDINELIHELNNLRNDLDSKEKEISELSARIQKQDKALESKKRDNSKLRKNLKDYQTTKKNLESKIKELEDLITQLNNIISSLNTDIDSFDEKYNELIDLKEKLQEEYNNLKFELKSLKREIVDRDRQIERLKADDRLKIIIPRSSDFDEDRKNVIEGLIIKKMLTGQYTLDEIILYLKDNGYYLNDDEVRYYFKSIKSKMRFITSETNEENEEDINKNEYKISISGKTKCIDLMVVSDFHLSLFGKDVIQDLELINDYCEDNKIKLILNAGDFFSWSKLKCKHQGTACQRIVDKAIVKYPYRKGIKHAVMGGNHDKDMLAVGVDPINLLANARDDFISLGYSHCKITFGGSVSILDSIGMHHPNRRYSNFVGEDFYTTEKIREFLNNYYVGSKIKNDDVYTEIIGHIHKSGLDTENGICVAPSYCKDRVMDGAWHLKVYFSDDNHISNIVFIPVIKTKKLIPTTEICYKKQLIKK